MIFEFVGLPATGKTTAIVALEKAAVAQRVMLASKIETIGWFVYGLVRYPVSVWRGVYLVLKYRPKLFVIWNYCVVRYARLIKAKQQSDGRWLIDEPPLQNMYSLLEKDISELELESLATRLFTAGQIVYFSIDEAERQRRKITRNRQGMPNEFNPDWNRRLQQADVVMKRVLQKRGGVYFATGDHAELQSFINT